MQNCVELHNIESLFVILQRLSVLLQIMKTKNIEY